MQRMTLVINPIKGYIKDHMWQYHQHIVQKYHTTYIFISSKTLSLIIYYFELCIFFIKEAVILSYIFGPLQESERPAGL